MGNVAERNIDGDGRGWDCGLVLDLCTLAYQGGTGPMLIPPHGRLSAATTVGQRDVCVQHAPARGHAKASVFTGSNNGQPLN